MVSRWTGTVEDGRSVGVWPPIPSGYLCPGRNEIARTWRHHGSRALASNAESDAAGPRRKTMAINAVPAPLANRLRYPQNPDARAHGRVDLPLGYLVLRGLRSGLHRGDVFLG